MHLYGINITIDGWITNLASLRQKYRLQNQSGIYEVIFHLYQRFGPYFPQQLLGSFFITIQDNKKHFTLLVNDRNASIPCYLYQSSDMPPQYHTNFNSIVEKCPKLTINQHLFHEFAIDQLPAKATCYNEVTKLLPGTIAILTNTTIDETQYWRPSDWAYSAPAYKTREVYYEAFQNLFSNTIQNSLADQSNFFAQLSGGLDSSSVSCVLAHHLLSQNKQLHTFTVTSRLTDASYRKHWRNQETQLITDIAAQYPNIESYLYRLDPAVDIFQLLNHYIDHIDQPIRNVINFNWIVASIQRAAQLHCKHIYTGQSGNGSISWAGFNQAYHMIKRTRDLLLNRHKSQQYFQLVSDQNYISIKSSPPLHPQLNLLFTNDRPMRRSATYAIAKHHKVELFDPTESDEIKQFCMNTPQWVYRRSRKTLDRRLLVREGLSKYLPDSDCNNTYRGEQAADWYLQYNNHIRQWRDRINHLSAPVSEFIWSIYDKEKAYAIMKQYPSITHNSRDATLQVRCQLLRLMSAAFFLDHIANKPNVSL